VACFGFIEGWLQSRSAALRVGVPLAEGIRSHDGGHHHRTVINKTIKRSPNRVNFNQHSLRSSESRRVKAALQMARLTPIKTLSGFDFSFRPTLERSRGCWTLLQEWGPIMLRWRLRYPRIYRGSEGKTKP
jgi:hypothetical protein